MPCSAGSYARVCEGAGHVLAEIKTFLDQLKADVTFQASVARDPEQVAVTPTLTAAHLRPLWDLRAVDDTPTEAVQAFRAHIAEVRRRAQVFEEQADPVEPRFRRWRDRQKERVAVQLGSERARLIRHLPAAFELSRGCSVGCWFCGVSAGKLEAVLAYTQENARFWGEVLEVVAGFAGPEAARRSFCYWATDPLDNPDYEHFVLDFYERLGVFPSLTTAQALKDPERTRRLLELARQRPNLGVHLSLLSRRQFDRVRELFSPEELLEVDLVPQFKGSTHRLAVAGRARSKAQLPDWMDPNPNTIACVSGFLINLVDRSLRLISPCPADDIWPNGYWEVARREFLDAADLERVLEGLARECLGRNLEDLPRLRWLRGLTAELLDDGFVVSSPATRLEFRRADMAGYMRELGSMLGDGRHPSEEIEMLLSFQFSVPETVTRSTLEVIYRHGILDEEPAHADPT